jgi:hypothetical protein
MPTPIYRMPTADRFVHLLLLMQSRAGKPVNLTYKAPGGELRELCGHIASVALPATGSQSDVVVIRVHRDTGRGGDLWPPGTDFAVSAATIVSVEPAREA